MLAEGLQGVNIVRHLLLLVRHMFYNITYVYTPRICTPTWCGLLPFACFARTVAVGIRSGYGIHMGLGRDVGSSLLTVVCPESTLWLMERILSLAPGNRASCSQ